MARIAGIDLPREKRIEIGLTYIYGIGRTSAKKILELANVDPDIRVKDLSEDQEAALRDVIDKHFTIEGDLRREVAMNIKRLFPECCLVFILPPSMHELERRLRKRGTETEEKIIERTAQAREELKFAENYDYLIVNGELEKAVDDLRSVISAEKLRKSRRMPLLQALRNE